MNPNGVGSLFTRWRLELCSGLRVEPGHTGRKDVVKEEEEKKSEGGQKRKGSKKLTLTLEVCT